MVQSWPASSVWQKGSKQCPPCRTGVPLPAMAPGVGVDCDGRRPRGRASWPPVLEDLVCLGRSRPPGDWSEGWLLAPGAGSGLRGSGQYAALLGSAKHALGVPAPTWRATWQGRQAHRGLMKPPAPRLTCWAATVLPLDLGPEASCFHHLAVIGRGAWPPPGPKAAAPGPLTQGTLPRVLKHQESQVLSTLGVFPEASLPASAGRP